MKNSFCILQLWEGMTVLPKVWYVGIFFFFFKKQFGYIYVEM